MSKPKHIERFVQTLITQHGYEFATYAMRLTRVPAHSTTFSRIYNIFYQRVYPEYHSQQITSKFATSIKNLSNGKHNFISYCNEHWKTPTIKQLPNNLIFNESKFRYEIESNNAIKRIKIHNRLQGDELIEVLVNLTDNDVYTNKVTNAKSQQKKYINKPVDESYQHLKKFDYKRFPIWFKRDDCNYFCELLAQGIEFNQACEQACYDMYQISNFDLTPCTDDEIRKISLKLDEIFKEVKNEISSLSTKKKSRPLQYVYLVILDDNLIKIGGSKSSENLEARLKDHHSKHPKLRVVSSEAVQEYQSVEKVLKAAFCSKFNVAAAQYQDPKRTQDLGKGEYFSIKRHSHHEAELLFKQQLDILE